ncbi:Na(+)/H(+) antiporter subunit D [Hyphomonas pacifica]|uniref:Cation:proton antiporter n=1 Tax=Hyphomonas pacifica TaxID=1280941 RepID=A0A062TTN5_9PROT|nr:Na(+)/H(+) antiporter subunit D [Hyphomonas pacifica]KCZ46787.1 cation:proton antiporter [Hyphomonas pacifica]MBR9808920.1 Na(+)/H(+) antiporter subunit D [Alphaproteobacteria bacterium]RAN30403.1 cation:proton antiporter [Hyphomonas pacifica]
MTGPLSMLNPGWLMIAVGLVALFLPMRRVRQGLTIATPIIAIILLALADQNVNHLGVQALGIDFIFYRVDGLSFIFGLAFLLAALLNAIYAWHTDDRLQDGMAMAYAGAAVAATFSGDMMSLFVFWELTAITSVFLILRAGTRAAYFASMRYLAIQILSGVLLLAGIAYVYHSRGDLSVQAFTSLKEPGAILVFIALGIKAAFPFLHNWLQDSYPKATVVGAVVLSAFTTKLAVYAFARMFPGHDALIWIGAVMTVFPVFFAVIENDLRKVLAYSLNNQVGFMICAIGLGATGVGNALALNGASAHAFCHIIYKGLLFMSMGAVMYRTGTTKASELGGLYKSMPWTTVFCIIGAMSISAFPLFSGFAAKSLTMSAVGHEGYTIVWLMLLFASAGVLEHSGIKIPYFAFFGHDSGKRVKEAPFNMLLAMGLAAFICVAVGIPAIVPGLGYEWLYNLLPYREEAMAYNPFTLDHVLTQMQLLVLAIFAFVMLKRLGWYPPEKPGVVLDTDWVYRKAGYGLFTWAGTIWQKAGPAMTSVFFKLTGRAYDRIEDTFSPRGELARGGLGSAMAIWTAILLGLVLLLAFITSS